MSHCANSSTIWTTVTMFPRCDSFSQRRLLRNKRCWRSGAVRFGGERIFGPAARQHKHFSGQRFSWCCLNIYLFYDLLFPSQLVINTAIPIGLLQKIIFGLQSKLYRNWSINCLNCRNIIFSPETMPSTPGFSPNECLLIRNVEECRQ